MAPTSCVASGKRPLLQHQERMFVDPSSLMIAMMNRHDDPPCWYFEATMRLLNDS